MKKKMRQKKSKKARKKSGKKEREKNKKNLLKKTKSDQIGPTQVPVDRHRKVQKSRQKMPSDCDNLLEKTSPRTSCMSIEHDGAHTKDSTFSFVVERISSDEKKLRKN
jgi:hypothetical protein